jgi:hypothetical protein
MTAHRDSALLHTVQAFISIIGEKPWAARMAGLACEIGKSPRVGRALLQRHGIEITIERLRRSGYSTPRVAGEHCIAEMAASVVAVYAKLSRDGRAAMRVGLRAALVGNATLLDMFHLVRTAAVHEARGFKVQFAGLEESAAFDLLITRDGMSAEIACDVVSAEEGRDVHRGAWTHLADGIDPDLQTWLAAHPGRYLLKLTLPQGLRAEEEGLAALQGRIRTMLETSKRADHDEAAVLRLDPLMLAASQADELGLMSSLKREFGHEAHLAVTAAGGGVFVMAARAGRENDIAVAIRRRMAAVAPARLTGTRPGILAMFVDDTDRAEWRHLRERLELEGEARQFLTFPEARCVVAVTYLSRAEMFGAPPPDAAPDGELRFRNPGHPAAKAAALAPAVLSSM